MYNRLKNKVKVKEDVAKKVAWKQHKMLFDKDGATLHQEEENGSVGTTGRVWTVRRIISNITQ